VPIVAASWLFESVCPKADGAKSRSTDEPKVAATQRWMPRKRSEGPDRKTLFIGLRSDVPKETRTRKVDRARGASSLPDPSELVHSGVNR